MHACLYRCLCVLVCLCLYMSVLARRSVCGYVCVVVCVVVCLFFCVFVCYLFLFICMLICARVCVHVCVGLCVYVFVPVCVHLQLFIFETSAPALGERFLFLDVLNLASSHFRVRACFSLGEVFPMSCCIFLLVWSLCFA